MHHFRTCALRSIVVFLTGVGCCLSGIGCATKSLISTRLESPAPTDTKGVVYHLPKSVFRVTTTYTLTKVTPRVDGVSNPAEAETTVAIVTPVAIAVLNVPDPQNKFLATGLELTTEWYAEGHASLSIGPSSMLGGVSTKITDERPAVVQASLTAAAKIAKMALVGPVPLAESGPSLLTEKRQAAETKVKGDARIKSIDDRIKALLNNNPLTEADLKAVEALLKIRATIVTDILTKEMPEVTTSTVVTTTYLDPSDTTHFMRVHEINDAKQKSYLTSAFPELAKKVATTQAAAALAATPPDTQVDPVDPDRETAYAIILPPKHLMGLDIDKVKNADTPILILALDVSAGQQTDSSKPVVPAVEEKRGVFGKTETLPVNHAGVLHRVPAMKKLIVKQQTSQDAAITKWVWPTVLDEPFSLAQFGITALTPVMNKPWAQMQTEVMFDAASGYLTQYKTTSTSSATAVAEAITTTSTEAIGVLTELKNKAKNDLAAKKEMEEAERDLAKAELEKLQAEESLKKYKQGQQTNGEGETE